MSVILPKDLIDFLAMPFEMEMMCLPCHYPDIASFLDFQEGYRFCGNSATDLTGHQAGDWHPEAYVIAVNYFADPFVIYLTASAQGFPVYYAQHGAGRWDFEKIAENLDQFQQDLKYFQTLEQDKLKFAAYIQQHKDLKIELWNELYCSLQNTQISQLNENTVVEEYTPLIYGKLILTEIGQHKLKVVSFIKQHLKLTCAEALHCIQQLPLEIDTGSQQHCQCIQIQLENIGATTEFLANENQF